MNKQQWILTAILLLVVSLVRAQTTVEYIHTDALGSPVAVTNASGAVIERTVYEPYGAVINRPVTNGPGYTGHVMDAVTGLNYMQQRYYDPQLGRFLSNDPVTAKSAGANFNRYWYANNNPYTNTDPDGRLAQFVWGALAGAAVEVFVQTAIQGRSFSEIDRSNVVVAAGAGAVTGGVASLSALAAARSTISVSTAVAQTAAASGAAGVVGSVATDVANGESPSASKAALEGLAAAAGGGVGSRLTLAPLASLEGLAAKGGIAHHVAETTRSAIVGSDKSVLSAATSSAGASAGEALNAGVEVTKGYLEKTDSK